MDPFGWFSIFTGIAIFLLIVHSQLKFQRAKKLYPFLAISLALILVFPLVPQSHAALSPIPPPYQKFGPFHATDMVNGSGAANMLSGGVEHQAVFSNGRHWLIYSPGNAAGDCTVASSVSGFNGTWVKATLGFSCTSNAFDMDANSTTMFVETIEPFPAANNPLVLHWFNVHSDGTIGSVQSTTIGPAKANFEYYFGGTIGVQSSLSSTPPVWVVYMAINSPGALHTNAFMLELNSPYASVTNNYTLAVDNVAGQVCEYTPGEADMGSGQFYTSISLVSESAACTGPVVYTINGGVACVTTCAWKWTGTIMGPMEKVSPGIDVSFPFSIGNSGLVLLNEFNFTTCTNAYCYIVRTDHGSSSGTYSVPTTEPVHDPAATGPLSEYAVFDNFTKQVWSVFYDSNLGVGFVYGSGTSWTNAGWTFPTWMPQGGGSGTNGLRSASPRYNANIGGVDKIWTVWTDGILTGGTGSTCTICRNEFGEVASINNATTVESPKVLLVDDFLTGPIIDSQWTIDKYQSPSTQIGEYTTSGYAVFSAQPTSTIETIHSVNSIYDPSQYSNGNAVKRKMTVSLFPFSKSESATANIRVGLSALISSGTYPSSGPFGTSFIDGNNNCIGVSADPIGTSYILMDNSGGVIVDTCGGGSNNRVTIESGLNPTLYTVFTIETYGIFCSVCANNAFVSWTYFRVYQENSNGVVISSTDKNMNFTSGIAPLFQTQYAFVSQQNSNSASSREQSYIDLVQVQNYGSPVCLFGCIPPINLVGLQPFSSLWSLLVSFCQYIGLGDLGLGSFFLFAILSSSTTAGIYYATRNYGGVSTFAIFADLLGISAVFITSGLMGGVWAFSIVIIDVAISLFTFRFVFLSGGSKSGDGGV